MSDLTTPEAHLSTIVDAIHDRRLWIDNRPAWRKRLDQGRNNAYFETWAASWSRLRQRPDLLRLNPT